MWVFRGLWCYVLTRIRQRCFHEESKWNTIRRSGLARIYRTSFMYECLPIKSLTSLQVFPDWFANNTQSWWTEVFKNWSTTGGVDFSGIWLDMNEGSSFCDGSWLVYPLLFRIFATNFHLADPGQTSATQALHSFFPALQEISSQTILKGSQYDGSKLL